MKKFEFYIFFEYFFAIFFLKGTFVERIFFFHFENKNVKRIKLTSGTSNFIVELDDV